MLCFKAESRPTQNDRRSVRTKTRLGWPGELGHQHAFAPSGVQNAIQAQPGRFKGSALEGFASACAQSTVFVEKVDVSGDSPHSWMPRARFWFIMEAQGFSGVHVDEDWRSSNPRTCAPREFLRLAHFAEAYRCQIKRKSWLGAQRRDDGRGKPLPGRGGSEVLCIQ